jgi:DNA topoisomerase IB
LWTGLVVNASKVFRWGRDLDAKKTAIEIVTDPVESAKAAGLRYVTDTKPGIHQKRSGKGFRYVDADGKPVRDKETLARIKSLVIPPMALRRYLHTGSSIPTT